MALPVSICYEPSIAKLAEARQQLDCYAAALREKYGMRLKLQTHAVVGIDLARLVWASS